MMTIDSEGISFDPEDFDLPAVMGIIQPVIRQVAAAGLSPIDIGLLFGLVARLAAAMNDDVLDADGDSMHALVLGFTVGTSSENISLRQCATREEFEAMAEELAAEGGTVYPATPVPKGQH